MNTKIYDIMKSVGGKIMFKDKLKSLRENANMTQKELGEKIYASRSAVSKWELGNGIPSDTNLEAISKLFNVTEEWLLDREDLKTIVKKIENLLNQKEKEIDVLPF